MNADREVSRRPPSGTSADGEPAGGWIRAKISRARRVLLGGSGKALLGLAAPTAIGILLDLVLRPRSIAVLAFQGKAIYASSWLVSAAFWALPLAVLGRVSSTTGASLRRACFWAIVLLWILPLVTLCFPGQATYYRALHSYVGRDTVRLGIGLRGTVLDWFRSFGGPWLAIAILGAGGVLTAAIVAIARRLAPRIGKDFPWLLAPTFAGAALCFWTDNVDSRFLQAATPDACLVHGLVHALRVTVTGKGDIHQGMSVRTPARLPELVSARRLRPRILVVLTESVRADATCSDPPPLCSSPVLDPVAGDRVALGALTTQTPNTFSSFLILTTGLSPDVDFRSAHTAPVLWEVAHAVGYATAYVTSQNPNYEDFGAFTRRAGIDELLTAVDLGGLAQEQLGAPDERAVDAMLRFVRSVPGERPYFAVLHLSNTHAPYRTDPGLRPFVPESVDPLGDPTLFHNHYRNSVRSQERLVAGLLGDMRTLPGWSDTVVLFLSDHGEQFREHGGLYHNHSLYDEELRVPGWIVAGSAALGPGERTALSTYRGRRTFMGDVHATLLALFGVEPGALPLHERTRGRSLLSAYVAADEKPALLATSTSVWEPDDAWFGAMFRERVVMGREEGAWSCFDTAHDPEERRDLGESACGDLARVAQGAFRSRR